MKKLKFLFCTLSLFSTTLFSTGDSNFFWDDGCSSDKKNSIIRKDRVKKFRKKRPDSNSSNSTAGDWNTKKFLAKPNFSSDEDIKKRMEFLVDRKGKRSIATNFDDIEDRSKETQTTDQECYAYRYEPVHNQVIMERGFVAFIFFGSLLGSVYTVLDYYYWNKK